jgi:Tol biopolymer transport system component
MSMKKRNLLALSITFSFLSLLPKSGNASVSAQISISLTSNHHVIADNAVRINSSITNNGAAFTPAPLSLGGRIVYHSYSDYLAAPVDEVDGNIFLYQYIDETLSNLTASINVENSMNPHFSPDGSQIVFMARPVGSPVDWTALELYLLDLAENTFQRLTTNDVPDEDPKFSPDGRHLVFKRSQQIWTYNLQTGLTTQLTSTSGEKSGPNFSLDGSKIVFWYDTKSSSDIGWIPAATQNADSVLFGETNVQEMYPVYWGAERILYSKWEYAESDPDKPNLTDDIYVYSITSGTETKLGNTQFNLPGVDEPGLAQREAMTYILEIRKTI